MKTLKLYILSVFFIFNLHSIVQAQEFHTKGGLLYDFNGKYHKQYFPIKIKGLPNKIDESFGLLKVCLNINHTKVSDLKIQLISPDSTVIWITNRNGGDSGQNYTETCFTDGGFNGLILEGKAPFLGEYIPDGSIASYNNGQNPNGAWKLIIEDLAEGNVGELTDFGLTFGPNPLPAKYKPCREDNGLACKCPKNKKKCDLLPDLMVSAKMTELQHQEYAINDPVYPGQFRLAVALVNVGWGPLEVRGTKKWICNGDTMIGDNPCPDVERAPHLIEQVIYRKEGKEIKKWYRSAGVNFYEPMPGHNHFHSENFVTFSVRKRDENEKDPTKWPIMGEGTKAGYCLFDNGSCTDKNGMCQLDTGRTQFAGFNNLANYGFGHYLDCEAYLQGLSVGGLDNYGISFEGQYINIPDDMCNGLYYLVITVDPDDRYLESDETNNTIVLPIQIKLRKDCK